MVNREKDLEMVKESLKKLATGYDYEEKEIIADKSGKQTKVKIIKKHIPPNLDAIRVIDSKINSGKW